MFKKLDLRSILIGALLALVISSGIWGYNYLYVMTPALEDAQAEIAVLNYKADELAYQRKVATVTALANEAGQEAVFAFLVANLAPWQYYAAFPLMAEQTSNILRDMIAVIEDDTPVPSGYVGTEVMLKELAVGLREIADALDQSIVAQDAKGSLDGFRMVIIGIGEFQKQLMIATGAPYNVVQWYGAEVQ